MGSKMTNRSCRGAVQELLMQLLEKWLKCRKGELEGLGHCGETLGTLLGPLGGLLEPRMDRDCRLGQGELQEKGSRRLWNTRRKAGNDENRSLRFLDGPSARPEIFE